MSTIPADNNLLVFATLSLLAWIGFAAERTRWGRLLTGIVWTGGLAILLSNTSVLPRQAQAYDFVKDYLVALAIPLFLFRVNLREILYETGKSLLAFAIGAVTTVIGVLAGTVLFNLGKLEAELGGIFAATYIGGTLNFAASSEALSFPDDVLLSASLAADSLVGKTYLLLLASLPAIPLMRKLFRADGTAELKRSDESELEAPDLFSLASALSTAMIIVAAGYVTAELVGMYSYGILFVTAFALIPGSLLPSLARRLSGGFELGMICAYLFFAAVGAGADVTTLVSVAPAVMGFAILIVVVHGLLLFPLARLAGLTLAETITASNACILGPTTAAALAAARGWRHLVSPGLLMGLLGYGVGTFIGVFLAKLLA